MESTASGEVVTHLFPALGPALVISMGYIDLGKWLAAVDGGARFGNDLVLLVLFFNLIAIMCQYLAACVGIVTGKSLAEICITEYPGPASMILGIQAEISMITSDLTMILGLSYGFNLLLGINLLSCICLAAAGSVLLPLFSDFLNYRKAEFVYVTLSALALLLYVLGVLISQPEIPLGKNVMFPKLSGESAYSLMAFLGANLMAHNFYVHSSIVRQQKRILGVRVGALLHDHFFAILFIFTGISLVNYVLMNSAAAVFGSTDIELNFDDLSLLMDQIFRIPIAPIAIFLVLLFSSQITSSAWNTDGPKLLTHSFGKNVSVWEHVLIVKAFSVVPALGFATFGGAEGVYQFLIFCQVVHATLLPSSVIPLFRVASSRSIMGAFKMPWYLEIMSLLAFLGMLASNVIFIIEMLFGNSNWINDLRGSVGGTVTFAGILLAACGSMFFTLYLAVTPLKSASDMPETEVGTVGSPKDKLEVPEGREDDIQEKITTSIDQFALEPGVLLESHLDQSDTTFDSDNDRHKKTDTSGASDMVVDSDHDSHQPNHGLSTPDTFVTPIFQTKEPMSINVVDLETVNDESATILLDPGVLERERHEFVAMPKDDVLDTNLPTNKDTSEIVVPKEPIGEPPPVGESVVDSLLPSTSEDSGSSNIEKVKVSDGGVGSGSLSKLSGLGRAARRQLAVTLDEFWGHLFDFHGKPTPEAGAQKYDALLGLEVKNVSSTKVEIGTELSTNLRADVDRAPVFQLNQMEYSSPKLKSLCNADLSYGFQMGSSSRSRNMQVLNTSVQNASNSLLEPNERRYSSLYLPQYSNNHDYQPATVHGYQITSYLKQIGAGRNPYSPNVAPESPRISKSGIRVPPGFGDSVPYSDRQNGLGSLATSSLQSPTASRVSRGQVEGPYFDPSLIEPSYNTGPSAHSKKYHSSPDISALIAASRNYYLNESKLGGPIGPSPSAGRVAAKQQQYLNPISKTGVSSAFDELYPTNLQRKVFSPQPQLNTDTFWSRQPFEQLFGVPGMEPNRGVRMVTDKLGRAPRETFSYAESEVKLLQSLRVCISKLLKMEGSDWLFRPNSGCDEELIFLVSTQCKVGVDDINQLDSGELHLPLGSVNRIEEADIADIMSLPNCAEGCIWRASLVVSFGVWCVHRILELSLVESRPELWGKYTYVLNRLQGILDLAFSKPRETLSVCSCFDVLPEAKPIKGSFTTASTILEIIKDVEIAVSGRKGRTGTAAGDVAFPKGKENLASVLKRYKRRLSNKTSGTQDASSRKIHTASVL